MPSRKKPSRKKKEFRVEFVDVELTAAQVERIDSAIRKAVLAELANPETLGNRTFVDTLFKGDIGGIKIRETPGPG
jgi:hypothetical protein